MKNIGLIVFLHSNSTGSYTFQILEKGQSSIWNSLPPRCPQFSHRDYFAVSSKLTSSALAIDSDDFPASVCTSELCKEGYSKLQLYRIDLLNYSCIVLI